MADLIEAAVTRLWDCLERDQRCAGVTVKHTDLRIALSLIKHLTAEREKDREALERVATVDMGGGFLGADACRKIARERLEE